LNVFASSGKPRLSQQTEVGLAFAASAKVLDKVDTATPDGYWLTKLVL
jgi:hypothetical protein